MGAIKQPIAVEKLVVVEAVVAMPLVEEHDVIMCHHVSSCVIMCHHVSDV